MCRFGVPRLTWRTHGNSRNALTGTESRSLDAIAWPAVTAQLGAPAAAALAETAHPALATGATIFVAGHLISPICPENTDTSSMLGDHGRRHDA